MSSLDDKNSKPVIYELNSNSVEGRINNPLKSVVFIEFKLNGSKLEPKNDQIWP